MSLKLFHDLFSFFDRRGPVQNEAGLPKHPAQMVVQGFDDLRKLGKHQDLLPLVVDRLTDQT